MQVMFYSQMNQAVPAKMEEHAAILQGVDKPLYTAHVHLDILAADAILVSKQK